MPPTSHDSSHAPAPLTLPADNWEGWVAETCDGQLDEARRLVEELKAPGTDRSAAATLSLWNDLHLALRNAGSVALLLANVHPDESVRTRAEQAQQDAATARDRDRAGPWRLRGALLPAS